MKIIKPSATIIEDELAKLSIHQRIDYVASICYQRPPRPTEEEAQEFCQQMTEKKHFVPLEMAVVHLVLPVCDASSQFLTSKYIAHAYNAGWCLLTGSIRAFMEFLQHNDDSSLLSVRSFLAKEFPLFFQANNFRDYPKVRFAKPEEIPWQHKHVAVRLVVNRAISHQLVRHRPSSILQECVAWDEEVHSFSSGNKWTMERLYQIFNTASCGIARKTIRVRTKDSYGEIVPSQIISVTKSGEKELFRVTTKNGRSLKTSKDHIYFTENGERRLKDISVGDLVWVNGKVVEFDWLRNEYLVKNRERADIAKEIGMSDAWLGKLIRDYGLQKPKSQYPNRGAGRGVPGMHSDSEKARISERMTGEGNHRWVGDAIQDGHARAISMYDISGETCVCGSPAVERHHIDRDSTNNDPSNIEFCCTSCHSARHRAGAKIAFLDEVISIEACGTGMTYDIEVDHPEHNFVVGGIVVHNSQRYCKYTSERFEGEVSYIRPIWADKSKYLFGLWHGQMYANEEQYKLRLQHKLSPQESRGALANDAKTELIVYASLPEWKHILNTDTMRCSKHADPEMRRVMIPLREEFKEKYKEVEW